MRPDLVLGREAPVGRHRGHPALEQLLVVDVAEGAGAAEDAEADVARAVADAEHPAVAGQQGGLPGRAVPQLEPGLEEVVVGARGRVVGPHRDPERTVVTLDEAHGQAEPARSCRPRRRRRGRRTVPVRPVLRPRSSWRAQVTPVMRPERVQDGTGDGGLLEQVGALALGGAGQDLVEVGAGPDQAVARHTGELGPLQLQPLAAADDAQALVADPAVAPPRAGRPRATSSLTPRGVRPSPQTFSRGKAVFSSSTTCRPARAR